MWELALSHSGSLSPYHCSASPFASLIHRTQVLTLCIHLPFIHLLFLIYSNYSIIYVSFLWCLEHLRIVCALCVTLCFLFILPHLASSWQTVLFGPLFCYMCRAILNDGVNPSLTFRIYALPPFLFKPPPISSLVPQPAEICPLR